MKVAFHKFNTGNAVGGALYCYSEICSMLQDTSCHNFEIIPHNFFSLISSSEKEQAAFFKQFDCGDVIVANIGPLSCLYYFLRNKYSGKCRIIRDVRTSSWSPYWMQEILVKPYLTPEDQVIIPSFFCRDYFIKLFPDTFSAKNTVVCYPLTTSFPETVDRRSSNFLRLGYVGRISRDKNVDQVMDIFKKAYHEFGAKVKLHLAGPFGNRFSKERLALWCKQQNIPSSAIIHHGRLSYQEIWNVFGNIDVLLFPAVASVESLGRIYFEAARARVPVLSASYAAAEELQPKKNCIKTHFITNQVFDARMTRSLGYIDVEDAVAKLEGIKVGEDISRWERYQKNYFMRTIAGLVDGSATCVDGQRHKRELTEVASFLDGIDITMGAALHCDYNKMSSFLLARMRGGVGSLLTYKLTMAKRLLVNGGSDRPYFLSQLVRNSTGDTLNCLDLATEQANMLGFAPRYMLRD